MCRDRIKSENQNISLVSEDIKENNKKNTKIHIPPVSDFYEVIIMLK